MSDASTPVVIIHGLFGSTTNWRSFAKQLSEHHPVIVVDLRNHGRSPHIDSHTYTDMAADLIGLLDKLGVSSIQLCGHSMGGKVAMVLSLLYPERVERVAVLDIAPVEYGQSHASNLEKMIALDLESLESRNDADKKLSSDIPEASTRLFLLQSLVGSKGRFSWRLNLPVLLAEMEKISSFPFAELDQRSYTGNSLFMSGELSEYVSESDHSAVLEYFPKADFSVIPKAGHWLHAEQPQVVLTALLKFLQLGKKND